jgi:hypothetical protein
VESKGTPLSPSGPGLARTLSLTSPSNAAGGKSLISPTASAAAAVASPAAGKESKADAKADGKADSGPRFVVTRARVFSLLGQLARLATQAGVQRRRAEGTVDLACFDCERFSALLCQFFVDA